MAWRIPMLMAALVAVALMVLPASAGAHAERPSFYPSRDVGSVPKYRTSGPSLVVCAQDSGSRIRRLLSGVAEAKNLNLLARCRFRNIQTAVNRATNGTRILVLPGIYREVPSRNVPLEPSRCRDMMVEREGGGGMVASYDFQRNCPTAQNLIAVVGDDGDADRVCDDKCNLQIEGTGTHPRQVVIRGDGKKLNVIRADRADGIHLRNFLVELSDFNNIYGIETNGFRWENIITRYSKEYGILTFSSDHGLYNKIEAFGAGDSGVYPGSGPESHCNGYGIEMKRVDSHDNNMGYSGTAGNGVYAHHNRFHHNATGIVTDSLLPNHPGMPQDCAKFESNDIYSNNLNLFTPARQQYCADTPYEDRNPRIVCSAFIVPVGTGMVLAGGNRNIMRSNRVWDNWRRGFMLLGIPASIRGEEDPAKQQDTSHFNRYTLNVMGVRPARVRAAGVTRVPNGPAGVPGGRPGGGGGGFTGSASTGGAVTGGLPGGTSDPNGVDFWWDEQGMRNCWQANTGLNNSEPSSDPLTLPPCPGSPVILPGDFAKLLLEFPCTTWDPHDNPFPPGCDWTNTPPEPD